MMRRRRIRAAERPARRQANPPSPTKNELVKIGSFFFIPPRKNIEQALTRRPDIVFLSIFSCVRLPCGGGAFSFFSRRSRPPRRDRRPSPRTSGRRRERGSFPRRAAKHKVFVSKIKLSQVSCYVKNIFTRILLNLIDRYKLLR